MATRAYAYAQDPAYEPRTRPRRVVRSTVLHSGVAWIVVVAGLLAGLVALNVAVLQLNVRLDDLSQQRANLREENASLASKYSTANAAPLIQMRANARFGLVPAAPDQMTYVELPRR